MSIAIIDYGMGNLRSVQKAFERLGYEPVVTSDALALERADRIVLPGVGAIADALCALKRQRLIDAIHHAVEIGKPFLGICLGFQLLFDSSEENGHCDGLGLIPGRVVRFDPLPGLPVPHIGWNTLTLKKEPAAIFRDLASGVHFYFVHSYYAVCDDAAVIAATTDYGRVFCSAIARGNLFGTQFHPEKSQAAGMTVLKNFAELS